MLTIKRSCTNRIITRALAAGDQPFTAILLPDAEDCIPTTDLAQLINRNPGSMIVYNQHPEALDRIKSLQTPDLQIIIEICQETRGVLGLQAKYKNSPAGEILELIYQ
ncbi:MAG: hypothetical protein OEY09_16325 [Gammaproteobacteria bacterium]|nr:hypothetical protein [Gammaproteobacteria bacterium]